MTNYFYVEDTLTLREMILSIPQHLQNIHHFPDNVNYKVCLVLPSMDVCWLNVKKIV
jgi:hypothetical protein